MNVTIPDISGEHSEKTKEALQNFLKAFDELQNICPVYFDNQDDNGVILQFKGVSYDKTDKRLYIDIGYPT